MYKIRLIPIEVLILPVTNSSIMTEKQGPKLIKDIGEFGLIHQLTDSIRVRQNSTRKGIGDDAAVLDHGSNETVVTTDMLLEGVHFDLTYVPLKHLGYKSVIVNLSDLYAMNAIPQQITVSIGVSAKFTVDALEDLYEGIKLACANYDVDLVGGDTCASMTGLVISITALGMSAPGQAVFRSGAKKNDLICVSGDLGAAYMGLLLLQREKNLYEEDPDTQPDLSNYQYIIGCQLKPEARRDIITQLRDAKIKPSAMIDLSDGLSSDLLHLCDASGLGCRLYANKIPVDQVTDQLATEMGLSGAVAALNGGEDYELLFTVSLDQYETIEKMEGITVIGHLVDAADGTQLVLDDESLVPLAAQGWGAEDAL